jgi:hypothetical protein
MRPVGQHRAQVVLARAERVVLAPEQQLGMAAQHAIELPHRLLPLGARKEPAVGGSEPHAPQQPLAGIGRLRHLEELDEVAVDDQPPPALPDVRQPVVAQEVGEILVEVKELPGRFRSAR